LNSLLIIYKQGWREAAAENEEYLNKTYNHLINKLNILNKTYNHLISKLNILNKTYNHLISKLNIFARLVLI
jgi:hypothetical protein